MVLHNSSEEEPFLPIDIDLSQIFIGREHQLESFRGYLKHWQRQMPDASLPLSTRPSPNNKLQGLVILLHGRGGFGKTVLLEHFHEEALAQDLDTSDIVDWEFAVGDNRSLFDPAPGEHVDASQYFALLRHQLARVLARHPEEFKGYQLAVKDVNDAKRQARGFLDKLQGESHYTWLRGFAGEGVLTLMQLIFPTPIKVMVSQEVVAEKIKEIAGDSAQIGVEQIKQVWERLHDRLGEKLSDYLDQATRLARGLGSDLAHFAKKAPLLLFFDTYEEIDEADDFLRSVMGAAGGRIGWVIAGRDNLWAGLSQRLRSQETVYGYKDIVPYHLGWSVDFSADGVGDFTLSDVQDYFNQLSDLTRPIFLPALSEKDAAHLLHVTRGVPLAIRIAASLYLEKPDLHLLLEETESKREIIDLMVRRYLLHTRTNEADKARLYGLALLRRAEEPNAVCAALDLPPATSYQAELTRLQRRYGFVFTKQEVPSLHQEVRHFLRLWLLEHHSEPSITAVVQRLKQAHEEALQKLETTRDYASIQARLQDEQWVGCYLDLTEQYFWQDSAQGVAFALPFMCAAGIYHREANREVFEIGTFFEATIHRPYRNFWQRAAQSLRYTTSHHPIPDEIIGLQDLVKLARQSTVAFSSPLPDAQKELEAALWCRLGEAYWGKQEEDALYWSQKGLSQLAEETGQPEEVLKALLEVDIEEKEQQLSLASSGFFENEDSYKKKNTTATYKASRHESINEKEHSQQSHYHPYEAGALIPPPPPPPPKHRRVWLWLVLVLVVLIGLGSIRALVFQTSIIPWGMATAQSSVTATTTPTPQDTYNQATSGSPALNDPLSGQDAKDWSTVSYPQASCEFREGGYHISITQENTFQPCFEHAISFSNFAAQVEMTVLSGDGGALLFRAGGTDPYGYRFGLNRDFSNLVYGDKQLYSSYDVETNLNQTYLLTVIVRGNTIYLYRDKEWLATVVDSNASSGIIGLDALKFSQNAEVIYKNLKVWTLP